MDTGSRGHCVTVVSPTKALSRRHILCLQRILYLEISDSVLRPGITENRAIISAYGKLEACGI